MGYLHNICMGMVVHNLWHKLLLIMVTYSGDLCPGSVFHVHTLRLCAHAACGFGHILAVIYVSLLLCSDG